MPGFEGLNHTELIDPFDPQPICPGHEPPAFPSVEGRYGLVGVYLGGGTTMFCGGKENHEPKDVRNDCFKYVSI